MKLKKLVFSIAFTIISLMAISQTADAQNSEIRFYSTGVISRSCTQSWEQFGQMQGSYGLTFTILQQGVLSGNTSYMEQGRFAIVFAAYNNNIYNGDWAMILDPKGHIVAIEPLN